MDDLHNVRAVISDMDGVLWRGDTPLPGVAEFFGGLRRKGDPLRPGHQQCHRYVLQTCHRRLMALGLRLSQEEVLDLGPGGGLLPPSSAALRRVGSGGRRGRPDVGALATPASA